MRTLSIAMLLLAFVWAGCSSDSDTKPKPDGTVAQQDKGVSNTDGSSTAADTGTATDTTAVQEDSTVAQGCEAETTAEDKYCCYVEKVCAVSTASKDTSMTKAKCKTDVTKGTTPTEAQIKCAKDEADKGAGGCCDMTKTSCLT